MKLLRLAWTGCGTCLLVIICITTLQTGASAPGPDTTADAIEKIGTTGNWVKKREWLMKSHEAFTEIQDAVAQAEQIRTTFIDKFNQTDSTLDAYYRDLGLSEGKVTELFEGILHYLEKKRRKELAALGNQGEKPDPEMQAKIDVIEGSVKHYKLQLEQLRLDTKSVEDLGKSLVDRIKRVDERMNLVQDNLLKAQNIINDLWNIVDHNKARDKYYELKITILEQLRTEQAYLQEDLMVDFNNVIETIRTQITRTQEAIKRVESEGFFVKNRAKRIKELKLRELEAMTKAPGSAIDSGPQLTPTEQAAKKHKVHRTWYQEIYDVLIGYCAAGYNTVASGCAWIKHLVLGGPAAPMATKKPATQPVQQAIQAPATSNAPLIPLS